MYENDVLHCYECGEELQGTKYHIGDDNYICEECRETYYVYCDDCDELVREEDVITIDNGARYVCERCADNCSTCDHCGNLFGGECLAVETYYMTLCRDCYDNHYFRCEDCGEVAYLDYGETIDGYYYCSSCAEEHRDPIQPYSYKPDPVFYGGTAGYGLELEIDDGEYKREAAAAILEAGRDHIYIKEDGSLSHDGIEIVTHPATLEYHVNHFPWNDICRTAESYGYRSHDADTCGLHIHVSRSLFGSDQMEQDLTIAKIMLLVDRWYDTHLVQFARRDINKMRQWADKPNADIRPEDDEFDAIHKSKKQAGDRYRAINICNRNTVEFRFFRGTLNKDTIIASIQWVDTIINYCRSTQLKDLFDASWDDIFSDTEHVELTNYLKRRNLYNVKEGE